MTNENIYLKSDNSVVMYNAIFDERELRKLVYQIDEFYGKGRLHTEVALNEAAIKDESEGKKVEIVSFHQINVHFTEYKYYIFPPHTLSKLITRVLNSKDNISFSHNMSDLLKFKPKTNDEKKFYKKALESFNYEKSKVDNLAQIDLTERDFSYKLQKLKAKFLFNEEPKEKFVVASQDFENDLNHEITRLEERYNNNNAYNDIQKVNVRKRIIKALPSINKIEKDI